MTNTLEQLADAIDALPDDTQLESHLTHLGEDWVVVNTADLKALVADWREMDADRKAVIAAHKRLTQCLEKVTGKDRLFVP